MTIEELAERFWVATDPLWGWASREGYPQGLCRSAMWNDIAFAAQSGGWGGHRKMGGMNPPRMDIGQPVRPEVVDAYSVLARQYGYEIVEIRDEPDWFEFRIAPAIWPPPVTSRPYQMRMWEE